MFVSYSSERCIQIWPSCLVTCCILYLPEVTLDLPKAAGLVYDFSGESLILCIITLCWFSQSACGFWYWILKRCNNRQMWWYWWGTIPVVEYIYSRYNLRFSEEIDMLHAGVIISSCCLDVEVFVNKPFTAIHRRTWHHTDWSLNPSNDWLSVYYTK